MHNPTQKSIKNRGRERREYNARTIMLTIKDIVKQIASRTRQEEENNQINRMRKI